MEEEIQFELDSAKESMQKSIDRLESELLKIRAGKANPSMLSQVFVDYYGAKTPLSQVANISTPDARTLSVQPWEKQLLQDVSKAIIDANLGLNPQSNGDIIMIAIPALTEERRAALVKQTKGYGEDAKVAIRVARKDANDFIKKLQKDGLPEDRAKTVESQIQDITSLFSGKVDSVLTDKEKDIMTV
ncbi:MAG: ribosome recycling factor [Saprospiraceae bacterium]|jgi:ribosome recycling factor